MTIIDLLENNSIKFPHDVSLVEISENRDDKQKNESFIDLKNRKEITWKEFNEISNKIANYLISLGIKKGDKIAFLLKNCVEWLPLYFGILKCGAICVPLNFRYNSEEIKYCLDFVDCHVIIFGFDFIDRIEPIAKSNDRIKFIYGGVSGPSFSINLDDCIKNQKSENINLNIDPNDYAAIYFSSGTTGFPKAILHTHSALYNSCLTEQNHHKQKKDDVFLCIPPLYHAGAKMHWFGSLLVGGKTVLLRGVKPELIIETISKERCTIVWLLVPWVVDILTAIETKKIDINNFNLEQWWLMHIGAQPVPKSLILDWLKIFPHHKYDTNYGLTESLGPGCVHLGLENIDKIGSIGKAGYLWETKIVDSNHNEIKEVDVVGELAVRGPGVMVGYYKNLEATKEVKDDNNWLYTGDMAKYDEDYFIYLVDRKKDIIICGGENLYAVQIEDFLRTNKKVKDAAVISFPDKRLGEIPLAIIALKENETMSIDEVNKFCEGLARYKRPRKIIFANVPRNSTGKIEKPKLRAIYSK